MGLRAPLFAGKSVATRMLVLVLGLYLLIAVAVSLGHVWMEYRYQQENILQDLGDIEGAFKAGLGVGLWGLDENALEGSIEGMLRIPALVGVKIESETGDTVAIGGIVSDNGAAGNVGLHVNLLGLGEEQAAVHTDEPYTYKMFERRFPIVHEAAGKDIVVGRATIYSSSTEIWRRMKLQVAMLAVNAVLTLATFFVALLWAVNRYLRRPLGLLTDATAGISLSNLGSFSVETKLSGQNEINVLGTAITSMVADLHDAISKREKTEKELREKEERYRSLVENISLGITLIDQDHNVVMANAAQGKLFGKPASEFVGKKCFREFEKRDHVCGHCPGVVAMAEGVPSKTTAQGQRDDGSLFTVNIRAFPLRGADGEGAGFIEVVEDITEQLETQHALAAEKERLAVTLRSIGDGVITTDISGNVVLLNKVAEKLTGWSSEEAVGRPLDEVFRIINEQTREPCENPAEKVFNTGQIVGLANHTALIARDGTECSIADSGAPILDAQSRTIGVVLVFRDVTEQIRTEKERLKIKKLESIGVLAGGIAHDFNNVLAAILGNINLALFDPDLKASTKGLLSAAEKASVRATELTRQLLTFAKGGEPVTEASSLETVIKDSAEFVLHGENVACRYDIPEDLWLVDIDKGQMSQVIQNIVLNASHAMPEGGDIEVACENIAFAGTDVLPFAREERLVKITIRDSGIGIPDNVLEKIFDPYFSTKHGGSGLGLAITQSIVNKHKGHILVESSPGVGSTFTIYLPASLQQAAPVQEVPATAESCPPAKVLIMDDEAMVRDIAQAMLKTLGHEVTLSVDGEEAIRLYREAADAGEPFDLVIMDLTIPGGMGGKEAVRGVLDIDPNAKVVVSSGYSNDPVMAEFETYGFCAALVKPYKAQELSRTIGQNI